MKRSAAFFVLYLICFVSVSVVCGADRETANELYVKSGLEEQMKDIGPAIISGYKNNYSKTTRHTDRDKDIFRNIGEIVNNTFAPRSMKEVVVLGMMQDITRDDMRQVLIWLDSPTGKKITALEKRAGSKQGMAETQEYIKNIKETSLSENRIRLVRDLNSAMNITETTIDITLSIQFALSMTTEQAQKNLSGAEVQRLYEDFQKNRSRVEQMIGHQVHGSLLYTYQSLPDDELKAYVNFARSVSGKKYNDVIALYMTQVISESCMELAKSISKM